MNTIHPRKRTRSEGFTLIELILYIALISIFISGAVVFAWDILLAQSKSNVQLEVNQNMRLVTRRINYEIRNASAINTVSPTSICLASTDPLRNPTRIYISSGTLRVAWGGGSANCTSMTNDEPLSSSSVTVSALTFTDRSETSSRNIEYQITISTTADRQEWQKSETVRSSVELR